MATRETEKIELLPGLYVDPETANWLREISATTGADPGILIASILRDIRIDDEAAEADGATFH